MANSNSRRSLPGHRRRILVGLFVACALLALALYRAGPALVVRVPLTNPDAIISLASHEWERLPETAVSAKHYPSAVVLLTQPEVATPFNCHDCLNRVHRLGLLDIREDRIRLLALTGPGTHGEAVAARDYARHGGLRRLLIVTSPYHTRRALAVFRKVFEGTEVEIGVEPALTHSVARPERWWLGGYDRSYVAYEWAAVVYYGWKYGMAP